MVQTFLALGIGRAWCASISVPERERSPGKPGPASTGGETPKVRD